MPRLRYDVLPEAPDLSFENELWRSGVSLVAGVDEAGRGAFAGPVCAAAFIMPPDPSFDAALAGVRDSKEMTPVQRSYWAGRLKMLALAWGVGFASHLEIDRYGIVPATLLAVQRAMQMLSVSPEHVLLDYLELPACQLPQTALIKGDRRSLSIAAASILAKTARDALMIELDGQYPGYDLASNKGYGTSAHRHALERIGPSQIHRRSFRYHCNASFDALPQ